MSERRGKIIIGLTGGIGAGKTFVAEVFSKLGIPVFNSDFAAKNCMNKDHLLQQKIMDLFGNKVYDDGKLNRDVLANIVFRDSDRLQQLNDLVHPFVVEEFETWCMNQKADVVIKETAILFESKTHKKCAKVICVVAKEKIRIARVIGRDNITESQVISRIEMQMSQEEKIKHSDFLILNNGEELIVPQVLKIIQYFDELK